MFSVLFVMLLSQVIFSNVDVTMLGLMKGDYEVGLYSTSMKITNIISQLVSSVLWVVMPRISLYFAEKDYEKINSLLRKILGLFIVVGFPCVVGVLMLAGEIIEIVAGSAYLGAVPALRILMIAFFFSLFGGSFAGNIIMLPSHNEKKYMIVCCITAGVNVITNAILIPRWGTSGAAATTAFSSFLIMAMLLPMVDKKIKLEKLVRLFISPIVGCVGIVIVCLVIRNAISNIWMVTILSVLGSVLIYVFVVFVLKNEIVFSILNPIKNRLKR